jgi:pimeloyl-ACP methyl ester carboxylesterase
VFVLIFPEWLTGLQSTRCAKRSALPRLGEITIPVLVSNGTHDIMVHAYNSYILSQHLPDAQLILYPRSGHGFLFQHAEAFAKHVCEFLR